MTLSSRIKIAFLALLGAALVTIGPAWIGYQVARGDDAGVALVDAGPAATAPVASPDPADLARDVYRGVTTKDYFLVAGALLALVTLGVRWLLAKRWPTVEKKIYGVALVAVLAGLGGLSNAWLADERIASTTTLLGALKVWASAVFAYVTTRKVLEGLRAKGEAA